MAATGSPLHLIPAEAATPATLLFGARRKPLAEILLDMNAVTSTRMLKAIQLRTALKIDLPRILLAHDWVTEAQLIDALAVQWSAQTIDLSAEPPDPRLIDRSGVELCLQNGILPWRQIGDSTIVATSRPDDFVQRCVIGFQKNRPVDHGFGDGNVHTGCNPRRTPHSTGAQGRTSDARSRKLPII